MNEENRFAGRLRRYGQVGGRAAGFGLRATGSLIRGRGLDNDELADQLVASLGELRGPLVKVAQILATIPDAVPARFQDAFAKLQAHAPSMGKRFVARRMKAELGEDWQSKFAKFSETSSFAASLGQVHEAETLDGDRVAVKLQYPDMESAVEADLSQLDIILGLMRRFDGAIDTRDIREELADRLREELDYEREASFMGAYQYMLKELPVRVPNVHRKLSTRRLLVMEWLDGQRIFDAKAPVDELARDLFKAWWHPLVGYAVIHGDPHPGNYTWNEEHGLNLLDFGCVRVFSPDFIEAVIKLYEGIRDEDRDKRASAYADWGFVNLSRELMDTLDIWAGFIYGPLLDDRRRMIAEGVEAGAYGRAEATEVHARLKKLGPVKPPREFVFMDRAAISLGSVFIRLGAQQNWHRLFEEELEASSPKQRRKRQEAILSKV